MKRREDIMDEQEKKLREESEKHVETLRRNLAVV